MWIQFSSSFVYLLHNYCVKYFSLFPQKINCLCNIQQTCVVRECFSSDCSILCISFTNGSPCFRDHYLRLKWVIQSFRAGDRGWSLKLNQTTTFLWDEEACRHQSPFQELSPNRGICRTHISCSPIISLILWCLVHHDSIAVSKSLLLLLAVELEAAEFALAKMSLSLFPKTSFTATQTGNCLHLTDPQRKEEYSRDSLVSTMEWKS